MWKCKLCCLRGRFSLIKREFATDVDSSIVNNLSAYSSHKTGSNPFLANKCRFQATKVCQDNLRIISTKSKFPRNKPIKNELSEIYKREDNYFSLEHQFMRLFKIHAIRETNSVCTQGIQRNQLWIWMTLRPWIDRYKSLIQSISRGIRWSNGKSRSHSIVKQLFLYFNSTDPKATLLTEARLRPQIGGLVIRWCLTVRLRLARQRPSCHPIYWREDSHSKQAQMFLLSLFRAESLLPQKSWRHPHLNVPWPLKPLLVETKLT